MELAKHPKGLYILFLTEMWERFSFYGLRALLVLYLTQAMRWSDVDAYSLFGAYAALVYAAPVLGGFIADRLLGFKKAIFLGGVLIMFGHFSLAVSGHRLFYIGLAFVVCGTGYLKSCISGLVGELYGPDDPRRDGGFTIFYMGINLGAFAAGICVGWVAYKFGWNYGFGLAGIGMLFGLMIYVYGKKYLQGVGDSPDPDRLKKTIIKGVSIQSGVWLLSFLAVPGVALLLQYEDLVGWLLIVVTVVCGLLIIKLAKQCDHATRPKFIALVVLIIFAVGFFSLFEQAASSINLFTERGVDRHFLGWVIPTPAFQSLNPLYILILAPLFAVLWVRLSQKQLEPSTPIKFFVGLLLVALGFAALAIGAYEGNGNGQASMGWLMLAYLLQTLGELCLSPVGLSAVTKYSPHNSVGMMMGIWFLAMSTSNYLAAMMAKLAAVTTGTENTQLHYAQAFTHVCVLGLGIALLMLLVSPKLKRMLAL